MLRIFRNLANCFDSNLKMKTVKGVNKTGFSRGLCEYHWHT